MSPDLPELLLTTEVARMFGVNAKTVTRFPYASAMVGPARIRTHATGYARVA